MNTNTTRIDATQAVINKIATQWYPEAPRPAPGRHVIEVFEYMGHKVVSEIYRPIFSGVESAGVELAWRSGWNCGRPIFAEAFPPFGELHLIMRVGEILRANDLNAQVQLDGIHMPGWADFIRQKAVDAIDALMDPKSSGDKRSDLVEGLSRATGEFKTEQREQMGAIKEAEEEKAAEEQAEIERLTKRDAEACQRLRYRLIELAGHDRSSDVDTLLQAIDDLHTDRAGELQLFGWLVSVFEKASQGGRSGPNLKLLDWQTWARQVLDVEGDVSDLVLRERLMDAISAKSPKGIDGHPLDMPADEREHMAKRISELEKLVGRYELALAKIGVTVTESVCR